MPVLICILFLFPGVAAELSASCKLTPPLDQEILAALPETPLGLTRTNLEITRDELFDGYWSCQVRYQLAINLYWTLIPIGCPEIQLVYVDKRVKINSAQNQLK
jgi:hypothetical protein